MSCPAWSGLPLAARPRGWPCLACSLGLLECTEHGVMFLWVSTNWYKLYGHIGMVGHVCYFMLIFGGMHGIGETFWQPAPSACDKDFSAPCMRIYTLHGPPLKVPCAAPQAANKHMMSTVAGFWGTGVKPRRKDTFLERWIAEIRSWSDPCSSFCWPGVTLVATAKEHAQASTVWCINCVVQMVLALDVCCFLAAAVSSCNQCNQDSFEACGSTCYIGVGTCHDMPELQVQFGRHSWKCRGLDQLRHVVFCPFKSSERARSAMENDPKSLTSNRHDNGRGKGFKRCSTDACNMQKLVPCENPFGLWDDFLKIDLFGSKNHSQLWVGLARLFHQVGHVNRRPWTRSEFDSLGHTPSSACII